VLTYHTRHAGTSRARSDEDTGETVATAYASRYTTTEIPKYRLAEEGVPSDVAYQLIKDEMNLDGNPELNLASFVTTWMEPQADRLMNEALSKNYIDLDEYPQTAEIQNRCVHILSQLFHGPEGTTGVGTATVGSSEAIHLAGLALKWRWRARMEKMGLPTNRPNIVMSRGVQVVWEKFARYFEVEPRYVPFDKDRYVLDVDEAIAMVDENTIAIVGILGTTYTGEYEPIAELDQALSTLEDDKGLVVPIHVDAASGGFVAPFLQEDLAWDFRLSHVRSINVSGHKYGLVYPGIGWVIWREASDLPSELVFHVDYLGGDQPTFSLNFSRGAGQVIAQYYNFVHLGREGYRRIMANLDQVATYLASSIEANGHFEIVGARRGLPVVCFRLKGEHNYDAYELSNKLRERGWIVPAYTLAPNASDQVVLRIVVREGMSRDMAELLVTDIDRAAQALSSIDWPNSSTSVDRHERRSGPSGTHTRGIC